MTEIILTGIAIVILLLIIDYTMSYGRAKVLPPTHFKNGMLFNKKDGSIIGTRTPVYTDPISGKQFFGKTKIK